jgi:biopolymer transport protein ExbB/TolQ
MAATVTVVCPNPSCRHKMKAAAQHVGRQGRCPVCKTLVAIKPSEAESLVGLVSDDPSRSRTSLQRRGGETEVNTWLAALIGLTATTFLYALFLVLQRNNLEPGKFMCENVPIESMITFVCCWSAAILGMRLMAVRRQLVTPDRELELIPLDISLQITGDNVDEFLGHLGGLPPDRQDSILWRRIRGALEHFKFRNSVPEVQTYLSTQAELDASAVDSGYTLLRAFIWVCPILGFVGTVLGISRAMGELRNAVGGEPPVAAVVAAVAAGPDDFGEITKALKGVTSNLATAFSATLLGLVATIVLLFPTELLRKAEYMTLDRIEVIANESLLRRMSEGGPALDKDPAGYAREALQTAFQQHQQWLAQWQDQVTRLGQSVGKQFEVGLREAVQHLSQDEAARLDRMGRMAETLDQILVHAKQTTESAQQASQRSAADAERAVAAVSQLHERLGGYAHLLDQVLEQQQRLVEQKASGPAVSPIDALRGDVSPLVDLVDPTTVPPPPKAASPHTGSDVRSWGFGRWKGR